MIYFIKLNELTLRNVGKPLEGLIAVSVKGKVLREAFTAKDSLLGLNVNFLNYSADSESQV